MLFAMFSDHENTDRGFPQDIHIRPPISIAPHSQVLIPPSIIFAHPACIPIAHDFSGIVLSRPLASPSDFPAPDRRNRLKLWVEIFGSINAPQAYRRG